MIRIGNKLVSDIGNMMVELIGGSLRNLCNKNAPNTTEGTLKKKHP